MAIPKKKRREIIVDGIMYHYCITMSPDHHISFYIEDPETGASTKRLRERLKDDIPAGVEEGSGDLVQYGPADVQNMIRSWKRNR